MTIKSIPATDQGKFPGVVFWWSNLLGSHQLRVYSAQGEVADLRQFHHERADVEKVASGLSSSLNLPVYEIEIEKVPLTGLRF